jgi:hypothetical protein
VGHRLAPEEGRYDVIPVFVLAAETSPVGLPTFWGSLCTLVVLLLVADVVWEVFLRKR